MPSFSPYVACHTEHWLCRVLKVQVFLAQSRERRNALTELDIEQGWDFIYLYDGEDSTATHIGDPISGVASDGWPAPQTSSGATMFVHFEADASVQRPGFAAYASCPNQQPTFCDADEHVANHRCHHCDPGKENAAGNDASGSDTECSSIFCDVNQRVADNVCVACDPGKESSGGHDASQIDDTECALIPTTGMCVGNTRSIEDVACPESEGLVRKPDPETIVCGESCSTQTCCDSLPPTPPEVRHVWQASTFNSCPAMVCGARTATRTVQCVKVSIFSTGAVQREIEILAVGETSGCEEAERPSTTRSCENLQAGSPCNDHDPDTTGDVCTSESDDAQCMGVVALVAAVTFNVPVESLGLDELDPMEDIDASPIALAVKSSLRPVLEHSFAVRLTDDSIEILRIQAGSLDIDYKVELPPVAVTDEAKDTAVAAIANPEASGLRPDAMDLTVTDTNGRTVVSNGALPQPFRSYSYVWSARCPARQQPGVDSSGCPNACGSSEVIARDSWRCLEDGSLVHPSLCAQNGLGDLPVTYSQCCPWPDDETCVPSDEAEMEAARVRRCKEIEDTEERLVCLHGETLVKQAKIAAFVFVVVAVTLCLGCGAVCVWCCICRQPKPKRSANAGEGRPQDAGTNVAQEFYDPMTYHTTGAPVVVTAVPVGSGVAAAPAPGFEAPPPMPPQHHP